MANKRCKCRWCSKPLSTDTAYKIRRDGKNIYFCDINESLEWLVKTEKEEAERDIMYVVRGYVKTEILGYKDIQKLPKYLIERIFDIRSGATFEKGIGRIEGDGNGYPYEVILATFKNQRDNILYAFKNKQFENERQQINYMMAIVESNLNDNYMKWLRSKEIEKKVKVEESVDINPMQYENVKFENNTQDNKDLSSFIGDWE
jgi:YHS domain-containing protein